MKKLLLLFALLAVPKTEIGPFTCSAGGGSCGIPLSNGACSVMACGQVGRMHPCVQTQSTTGKKGTQGTICACDTASSWP